MPRQVNSESSKQLEGWRLYNFYYLNRPDGTEGRSNIGNVPCVISLISAITDIKEGRSKVLDPEIIEAVCVHYDIDLDDYKKNGGLLTTETLKNPKTFLSELLRRCEREKVVNIPPTTAVNLPR